jgi:hypothetical protein
MGYDFTRGATKQEIVKILLTPNADSNPVVHRLIGNNLWTVLEHGRGERFICLFRLEHEKGFGRGYKAMEESTGRISTTVLCSFSTLFLSRLSHLTLRLGVARSASITRDYRRINTSSTLMAWKGPSKWRTILPSRSCRSVFCPASGRA